jgi:hypothetical protein
MQRCIDVRSSTARLQWSLSVEAGSWSTGEARPVRRGRRRRAERDGARGSPRGRNSDGGGLSSYGVGGALVYLVGRRRALQHLGARGL